MKNLIVILLLLAFLTACGDSDKSSTSYPSVTDSFSKSLDSAEVEDEGDFTTSELSDELGIDILHEKTDEFDAISDDLLIELMEAICGALDRDASMIEVTDLAEDQFGPESGALVALAVELRCSQHQDALAEWADS